MDKEKLKTRALEAQIRGRRKSEAEGNRRREAVV